MTQVKQRPLRGEGLIERQEVCKKATETLMKMIKGEEYDMELMEQMYIGMSENRLKERKRMGGDWAITAATLTRDMRDQTR